MLKTPLSLALGLACVLTLNGCTTADGGQNRAATGAIIGAIAGAVAGDQTGGENDDRILGAVLGAAAGGALGHQMDKTEQEFNQALANERRNNEIEVQRVEENLLKLTLNNEVSFDTNSASLKPGFYGSMDKLANVLTRYPDSNVTVVGHTDSRGTDAYNQTLSEQRAQSVANYLSSRGVAAFRLSTRGEGERSPRADNSTSVGRAQNRRVEIFVQPRAQ